jgi:hypothetical protein
MSYYYASRPAAISAGQELYGASYNVSAQFEPDNGWVIIFEPKHGWVTLQNTNVDELLRYGEVHTVLKRTPPKQKVVTHTAKPRPTGDKSVGGGSVTLRLKTIWDTVNVTSRADRAKFVDAAVDAGINRNSAGAFWARYAREKGI